MNILQFTLKWFTNSPIKRLKHLLLLDLGLASIAFKLTRKNCFVLITRSPISSTISSHMELSSGWWCGNAPSSVSAVHSSSRSALHYGIPLHQTLNFSNQTHGHDTACAILRSALTIYNLSHYMMRFRHDWCCCCAACSTPSLSYQKSSTKMVIRGAQVAASADNVHFERLKCVISPGHSTRIHIQSRKRETVGANERLHFELLYLGQPDSLYFILISVLFHLN